MTSKDTSFCLLVPLGQEVTDQWYSEVKMFQFGREPNSLSAGKSALSLLSINLLQQYSYYIPEEYCSFFLKSPELILPLRVIKNVFH